MDKKSILIGALGASLLFVSIGAGTQQEPVTVSTVPESHVWEFHINSPGAGTGRAYSLNRVTGEVRKYETYRDLTTEDHFGEYIVTMPVEPKN